MSNEIIGIGLPQMPDDIDILNDLELVLRARGFIFIDMRPEYDGETILYRFQRDGDDG